MKWIEYQVLCNEEKNIFINKKIEHTVANLAIAENEAYNGQYYITEDQKNYEKKPVEIEFGGTGATNASGALSNLGAIPKKSWHSWIYGATWCILCHVAMKDYTSGSKFMLNIHGTRSGVVYNDTFVITAHHNQAAIITKIAGSKYHQSGTIYELRIVSDANGNCYVEMKESLAGITANQTLNARCTFINISAGELTTYTETLSGETLPSGYKVSAEMAVVASGFQGDLAGSATKATQDGDGNTITNTYLKKDAHSKASSFNLANIDNLKDTGTYYTSTATGYTVGGANVYYVQVLVESWQNVPDLQMVRQTLIHNENVAQRIYKWGSWTEWEWINPPVWSGGAFRTVERWGEKVVYVKLIDLGTTPSVGTEKNADVETGATIVGIEGYARSSDNLVTRILPAYTNDGLLAFTVRGSSKDKVTLKSHDGASKFTGSYTVSVLVKYVKD